MKRPVTTTLGIAVAASLLLAACGGSSDTGDKDSSAPTKLVLGFDSEPTTLDAQKIRDRGKDVVTHRINERLVDFDENVKLVPVLASEVPQLDPSNPMRWTVKLRKGVTFTNGEPWNAEALIANVKRILDKTYKSVYVAELGAIDHVTALDDSSVEIITNRPDPLLDIELRELSIVAPKAAAAADYASKPVGTGPYMLKSWDRGSQVTLVRNPKWWGSPKPALDEVQIKFIPDAGTRLSALTNGEVQIANNLAPSQAATAPQQLTSTGPTAAGWIRLDVRKKPFSDLRFRQALNYAVDKEGLSKALFNGQFEPASCQITTPQEVGSNPDLKAWPYDQAKAKDLIKQAGAEGTTLDLQWTSSIYGGDREMGDAVAGMFRAVGLKVKMTFNEIGPFVDKFYTTAPDKAVPMIYGETDNTTNHVMRQLGVIFKTGGPGNVVGDSLPEMTALLTQAASEMDPTKRQQLFSDFQAAQCAQAPVVYMLNRVETWGAAKNLKYSPNPAGAFARFYFEKVSLG